MALSGSETRATARGLNQTYRQETAMSGSEKMALQHLSLLVTKENRWSKFEFHQRGKKGPFKPWFSVRGYLWAKNETKGLQRF